MGGAAQQGRASPISWACLGGPGPGAVEGGCGGLLESPPAPRPLWAPPLLRVKGREGAEGVGDGKLGVGY